MSSLLIDQQKEQVDWDDGCVDYNPLKERLPGDVALAKEDGDLADPLRIYLSEVKAKTFLSEKEEAHLIQCVERSEVERVRAQQHNALSDHCVIEIGDQAKRCLVEAHLRLAVSVAKRYIGLGLPLEDLIQEGNVGLLHALGTFDSQGGYRFGVHAELCIRREISTALATKARSIRLPSHQLRLLIQLKRTSQQLLLELGREPTEEELATTMQLEVSRIREVLLVSRQPASLEFPVGQGRKELGSFLPHPVGDSDASYQLQEQIRRVLASLNEQERALLVLRFGLFDERPHTLREIGNIFGLSSRSTHARIQQVLARVKRLMLTFPEQYLPTRYHSSRVELAAAQESVTYHQQISFCGKSKCQRCHEGIGHGPYWYAYQVVDGRTKRTYIGKSLPENLHGARIGNVLEQADHIVTTIP